MRLLALALLLAGCPTGPGPDPDPDTSADTDPDTSADTDPDTQAVAEAPLVGPHDGRYIVGFQRTGDQFALGAFTVEQNVIRGTLRSGDGLEATIDATALADGTLRLDAVTSSSGVTLDLVEGRIGDGFLEGIYSVDGHQGAFAGRRVGDVEPDRVTEFDGSYDVALIVDDEEVALSVAHVDGGEVSVRFVLPSGNVTDVTGFVTSDGTFVLTDAVASDGEEVLAEATIDQDSFEVHGIYRAGDVVGRVVGRRAD